MNNSVVITSAVRTAVGSLGKSFKNISAVVMVQGGAANDQLYHSLCDSKPCHLVGDAMAQRRVNDAINEGELVARQI